MCAIAIVRLQLASADDVFGGDQFLIVFSYMVYPVGSGLVSVTENFTTYFIQS